MKNIIYNSFGKNFDCEFEKWFKLSTKSSYKAQEKKYFHLKQVHSDKIFHLQNENQKNIMHEVEGDAIITELENIFIGVKTADCVPVFIFCKNPRLIAAIHSGHLGSFFEITKKTIEKIFQINSSIKPNNLFAHIGPYIFAENYEVGEKFYLKWIQKNHENQKYFVLKDNKFYFDNGFCILDGLLKLGFKRENIEISEKNTFLDENFYSHRKGDLGRNINLIGIF
jgi:YfiH family protein